MVLKPVCRKFCQLSDVQNKQRILFLLTSSQNLRQVLGRGRGQSREELGARSPGSFTSMANCHFDGIQERCLCH